MTKAQAPTAEQTALEKQFTDYQAWKAKGDYRTPPPGLIGVNYGQAAQTRRQLEQTAVSTGAAGMGAGYANPTALAMTKDYLGNVNAENDANTYQNALQGYDAAETGNAFGLMNANLAQNSTVLGATENNNQFLTQKRIDTTPKSIWPALLGGVLGAAGSFLGGPAFGAMMRGGGGQNPGAPG